MHDFQFFEYKYDADILKYKSKDLNLLLSLVDQKIFDEKIANNFFKLWLDQELTHEFFTSVLETVIFLYELIFDGQYTIENDFDYDTYPFAFALIVEAMNHSQNIKQAKIEIFNETIKNLIDASKEWG
jgi:hypothetical protein